MLFDFFFGRGHDDDHASAIIRHLSTAFDVEKRFVTGPHHTQLRLSMTLVDVKITCRDSKIIIAFQGYSDNNLEDHVPSQVERVKKEIRGYLRGSHAAKWRHRVVGI